MGREQNHCLLLLFGVCLVVFGLVTFAEAAKPYTTPKPCPRNEFYTDCGGPCQTLCSTLGQPCLIQNIRCPEGCYCNAGYARDSRGKCIPQSHCPKNY